jgi:hypothetical protein
MLPPGNSTWRAAYNSPRDTFQSPVRVKEEKDGVSCRWSWFRFPRRGQDGNATHYYEDDAKHSSHKDSKDVGQVSQSLGWRPSTATISPLDAIA